VSRIGPGGEITPVISGLTRSEGIGFDPAGNLYVVEDVQRGRMLRVDRSGGQAVLASGLDAPEDAIWSPDGYLYITQSNVQFAESAPWDVVTGVSRVTLDGDVTDVFTDTMLWSYSALALDADGQLYVANEASNLVTSDSIFRLDPATGDRSLFASDLTSPEGLDFAPGGIFPLFVTEEDLGDGHGRLSLVWADGTHMPLCTGFSTVEDIALDDAGNLYVSEDSNGLIVQIVGPDLVPPGPPQNPTLVPPDWTATDAFTVTWENPVDASGIAGAYLKLDETPTFVTDGTFYAGEELAQVTGPLTQLRAGSHLAYLWLQDGVGNAEPREAITFTLRYDPIPPGLPLNLVAEPGDWTATNTFSLSWTNPQDLSGVMTACYRMDTPPVDAADAEDCQTRPGIETLDGVQVAESGSYAVYLWLADALGNVDSATAASTALRHDAQPPASRASTPMTSHTAPIRVTWTASDAHSGVETVHLWVRTGEGGSWADSGLSAQANGPGFFLYEPTGQGRYYFATRAVDRAGNIENEPVGDGDTQTLCQTWQRTYLPLLWKDGP
jgi:hypothetical protein